MRKHTEKSTAEQSNTSTVVAETTGHKEITSTPVVLSSSAASSSEVRSTLTEETKSPVAPEVMREPAESLKEEKEEELPQKSQKQKQEDEKSKEVEEKPVDDLTETSNQPVTSSKVSDSSSSPIEQAKSSNPQEADYDSDSDEEDTSLLSQEASHRQLEVKDFEMEGLEEDYEEHPLIGEIVSPKLRKFLVCTHFITGDLTRNGIVLNELEKILNTSWYGQTLHWLMSVSWIEKLALYPMLNRQSIKLPSSENQEKKKPKPQNCRNYFSNHVWLTSGNALLIQSQTILKYAYGVKGFLEGAETFEKLWTAFLVSLWVNMAVNYYYYPEAYSGKDMTQILVENNPLPFGFQIPGSNKTTTESILAESLTELMVWPVLIGLPLIWGFMNALLQSRHTRAAEAINLKKLIEELQNYQSTRWNDCGRWLLSSFIPDIFPSLLPALLLYLLPGPHLQHLLEKCANLIIWDGRLSAKNRLALFQTLKDLSQKSSKITQLETLSTLATIANGIGLEDLSALQEAGINNEKLFALINIKTAALTELRYIATHYHLLHRSSDSFLQSLPRYIYANYLMWCLGEPKSILLQPLFFLYRGTKFVSKIALIIAIVEGIKKIIAERNEKINCEEVEGKIWHYFPQRGQSECAVCPEWPVFYNNMFAVQTCWEDYLRLPRSAKNITDAIDKLTCNEKRADNFSKMTTIDFSKQELTDEWLRQVLPVLKFKVSLLEQLNLSHLGTSKEPSAAGVQAIADFVENSSVKILNLSYFNSHNNSALLIKVLPQSLIEVLDVSYNFMGYEVIVALAKVLNRTQLVELKLTANAIGTNGTRALATALPKSRIQVLDLSWNELGDEDISALAETLNQTNITTLNLAFNIFTANGAQALAQTLPQSPIEVLDLSNNLIGDEGIVALAKVLNRTKLVELQLAVNGIGANGVHELAEALPQSSMRSLDLSENIIGDEGITALVSTLDQTNITELILGDNNITPIGARALARALPTSRIQILDLTSNRNIGDEGITVLVTILNQTNITELILGNNNITPIGARALATALPKSRIQVLDLSANELGDEGIMALAETLNQTNIVELILDYNNITGHGVLALAQALPKSRIQILDLSSNYYIGDEGIVILAETLNQTNIVELILVDVNIGTNGVYALAEALPHSQIKILELSSNNISDVSAIADVLTIVESLQRPLWIEFFDKDVMRATRLAKQLATAKPATHLTSLDLGANYIGTESAKKICQKLPQTNIDITSLQLYFGNSIDPAQVNPYTCQIFSGTSDPSQKINDPCFISSAQSLSPFWFYDSLIRVYRFTTHYINSAYEQAKSYLSPQDEAEKLSDDVESFFSDLNDTELTSSEDDEYESENDESNKFENNSSPDFWTKNIHEPSLLADIGFFSQPRLGTHSSSHSNSFNQPTIGNSVTPQFNANGLLAWYVLYKAAEPLMRQTASGIKGFLTTTFTMVQQFWQRAPADTTPETITPLTEFMNSKTQRNSTMM